MSLFDRFRRSRGPRRGQGPQPSAEGLAQLREFAGSREGVEGFLEPPTHIEGMSLCLVAADGEYRRQPVKNGKQAKQLCENAGVPMYDARLVGYPQRMRDWDRGVRRRSVSLDDLPPLEVVDQPDRGESS